jgi:hypothetical protein
MVEICAARPAVPALALDPPPGVRHRCLELCGRWPPPPGTCGLSPPREVDTSPPGTRISVEPSPPPGPPPADISSTREVDEGEREWRKKERVEGYESSRHLLLREKREIERVWLGGEKEK